MSAKIRVGPFRGALIFLVLFALFLKFLYPAFAGWLASPDWFNVKEGLPSTGQEKTLYFSLALLALIAYLTYSEERWQDFKRPVFAFLQRRGAARSSALVAVPLLAGAAVFFNQTGSSGDSGFAPIRHPTPPDEFSKLKNPLRDPTPEMLERFEQDAREGRLTGEDTVEEKVLEYLAALRGEGATEDLRREAFIRRATEEGRILFQVNCRPCHGTKATGDGPMAVAQLRKPADFTGVETIATLVEGAVFWRVKKGGIGLPHEGGPWESAMPRWEADLTDEQIWKIILSEYDIAGNAPREPEKHE